VPAEAADTRLHKYTGCCLMTMMEHKRLQL